MAQRIHRLSDATISRIAAGEVLERPASAVKELVENALDAGATRIRVEIGGGGKIVLRVLDDGHGMPPEDLPLAVERHATSKLDESDIFDIRHFGFRGEALASIGSVARLSITSRTRAGDGWRLEVEGGRVGAPKPASATPGTVVEVRDLFYATPARLKFLRTDGAETQAVADVVRRLALAHPSIGFELWEVSDAKPRPLLRAAPTSGDGLEEGRARAVQILGQEVMARAVRIDAERDGLRLTGWAGLPDTARGTANAQYLFVNRRPVRDKALAGALKAAYQDLLPHARHPVAALFLDLPPEAVDVNVHPAKAEVRFRDPGTVRGLLVGAVRHALAQEGHRGPAGSVPMASLGPTPFPTDHRPTGYGTRPAFPRPFPDPSGWSEALFAPEAMPPGGRPTASPFDPETGEVIEASGDAYPLGRPLAHLYGRYILAEGTEGLVLVDAHAAHERLVYEDLKAQRAAQGVARQLLLLPEVVGLDPLQAARADEVAPSLAALGLDVEAFGGGAVLVRAVPAALAKADVTALVRDAFDAVDEAGAGADIERRLDAVAARIACHGSVRSGRPLRLEEMDALLRRIERTPHADRCNHGRPTSLALPLAHLDRLFGR